MSRKDYRVPYTSPPQGSLVRPDEQPLCPHSLVSLHRCPRRVSEDEKDLTGSVGPRSLVSSLVGRPVMAGLRCKSSSCPVLCPDPTRPTLPVTNRGATPTFD